MCNITVQWVQLGYEAGMQANVRDLFAQRDLGQHSGSYTSLVDVHDAAALRIMPVAPLPHHHAWRPWHGTAALQEVS